MWLILVGLASSVSFFWLPPPLIESTKFGATLIVLDTIWITALLTNSGDLGGDFYVVYFFVLFLAAISENLALMTLGTVLVVVIGNADMAAAAESGRNVVSETMPIVVAGVIQIGLGILKIKKS